MVEEYPVTGGGPYALTTGPDGALWFTELDRWMRPALP